MTPGFPDIQTYISDTGIVLPTTEEVKSNAQNFMYATFGSDIDLTDETVAGRITEGITMLYRNIIGINLQNYRQLNIFSASGSYLDSIATMFDLSRNDGEDDSSLRQRIFQKIHSFKSSATAIMDSMFAALPTLKYAYVAENRSASQNTILGATLKKNSILPSIYGFTYNNISQIETIAKAIYRTKAAGICITGLEETTVSADTNLTAGHSVINEISNGTAVSPIQTLDTDYAHKYIVRLSDSHIEGMTHDISFYVPAIIKLDINLSVMVNGYSGTDLEADIKNSIEGYTSFNVGTVSKTDIISHVSSEISGIFIKSLNMYIYQNGNPVSVNAVTSTVLKLTQCNNISIQVS